MAFPLVDRLLQWAREVKRRYRWRRYLRKAGWWRSVPLTRRELSLVRANSVLYFHFCHGRPRGIVFTCDNCDDAKWCTAAFDGYNTDGDCLMEK